MAPWASGSSAPSERQILDQLGITDVLGSTLLDRVENALASNEITPSVARDEIAPIHDRLVQVNNQLDNLLDGMTFLGVGQDELIDGVEVGVAIPRGAVHNGLGELGEEFVELRKILGPFQELALGNRPELEIRSIASSDFSVFVNAVAWGWLLSKGVREILETYSTILDIRLKRAELSRLVPEHALAGVDEHANVLMKDRLRELAAELIEEAVTSLDEHRKNELKIELNVSLKKLANRIDHGYSVDFRTPPEESSETTRGDAPLDETHLAAIREDAAFIRFFETPAAPILQLPEYPEEDDEAPANPDGDDPPAAAD